VTEAISNLREAKELYLEKFPLEQIGQAVTGHFKRDHPGSKLRRQNHPPLSARG